MNHSALWICHPNDGRDNQLVPVFRKAFFVKKGLSAARLLITAHGLYEAEINGMAVTETRFNPGLTSYYYRIQTQEYNVTALLHPGDNYWQTTVGDGWWRWKHNFGCQLALWAVLELQYEHEKKEIVTDGSFDAGTGPILRTDLQAGETYDGRLKPGNWVPAKIATVHTDAAMIPSEGVPVREHERFQGMLFQDAAGNTVVDFGQNIAGYVHMTLRNTEPGQEVYLKHGESLDKEGRFSTSNCDGGIKDFQEITYICKGAESEEYIPHFSVFGFRYVMVQGIDPGNASFEAVAVYSDMEETGDFHCSNPLINKLVENARWSQKGNFLDVPVDCPTRERNAWTGDAMIYCRTAAYFMNVYPFFTKWLKDQTIEQYASGKVGRWF